MLEREVKLSSKLKALELLGKHLGMWNDKLDVNMNIPIIFEGKQTLKNNEAFRINLPATIGKSYKDFWNTRKRYRVCKGSRGSKKSKTTALNMIVRLFKYPLANGLCVRRYSNTLRDSVYSDLKWAIHKLGLMGILIVPFPLCR